MVLFERTTMICFKSCCRD